MYGEALPASDWGAFQAALFKHLEFHPDDLRAFHSVTRSACLEVHAAIRRIDDATEVTTPLLQETLEQISKSFNDSLLALHEKIMQGVWGPSPYDAHQANAGKEAGAQSGQLYEPVENR
jgi:phytoene dehydrogenase-like protein